MTDALLRHRARNLIQAGRLPDRRPDGTWGGPGSGKDCAICDTRVDPVQQEVEFEFLRHGSRRDRDRLYAHTACFAAWEAEVFRLARSNDQSRAGPMGSALHAPSADPKLSAREAESPYEGGTE